MRKVQGKIDPNTVREVVAEFGDYLWLTSLENPGSMPFTSRAENWEPHTRTPKVGEVWSFAGEGYGTKGWFVVEVNPEEKYWRFINIRDMEHLPTETYSDSRTDFFRIYTRILPETSMIPHGENNA